MLRPLAWALMAIYSSLCTAGFRGKYSVSSDIQEHMLAGSDFRVHAKPFKALPGASLLEIPLQFGAGH